MRNMTELTQALAAYLKAPVAQPLSEDAPPIQCADAAYKALPTSSAKLQQVLPYTDPWVLEMATLNEDPEALERQASINTMVEVASARRLALDLAYQLAGGSVSPEQAAFSVFRLFQRLHEVWSTEVAVHELRMIGITNKELVREKAQQEMNNRKQEVA